MASRTSKTSAGKLYDPVFLFMLFAVVLAVSASFILRAAVANFGPPAAQAANSTAHEVHTDRPPFQDDLDRP